MPIFNLRFLIFNGRQGFTLIELLLYMGIFVILLSVFIQLFGSLLATQITSESSASVSEDAKYLIDRLSYDISRSQNITSPAQGVSASTLQFVVNNTQYTYSQSGNNLVLTNTNGANQLNSSEVSVSNLSFTPVGSSSGKFTVEVSFTLTGVATGNGGRPQTESIQTTLGNR